MCDSLVFPIEDLNSIKLHLCKSYQNNTCHHFLMTCARAILLECINDTCSSLLLLLLSLLLLLLLLKNVGSARVRESDQHAIRPMTPAPQYQPINRKKREGKIVEDYGNDRAA